MKKEDRKKFGLKNVRNLCNTNLYMELEREDWQQ